MEIDESVEMLLHYVNEKIEWQSQKHNESSEILSLNIYSRFSKLFKYILAFNLCTIQCYTMLHIIHKK